MRSTRDLIIVALIVAECWCLAAGQDIAAFMFALLLGIEML